MTAPRARDHVVVAIIKQYPSRWARRVVLCLLLAAVVACTAVAGWFGSRGWANAAALGGPGTIWSLGKLLGKW